MGTPEQPRPELTPEELRKYDEAARKGPIEHAHELQSNALRMQDRERREKRLGRVSKKSKKSHKQTEFGI